MDLGDKIAEMKLEEIRIYFSKAFPNSESTRQSALNMVIENFYGKYYPEIKKANYGEE